MLNPNQFIAEGPALSGPYFGEFNGGTGSVRSTSKDATEGVPPLAKHSNSLRLGF